MSIWPWIESIVMTGLVILLSQFAHDPLFLHSTFSWVWFAPVAIALRYGLWPSQLSILLLVLTYLYHQPSILMDKQSIQLFFLGGFLLTLSCVLFKNRWSKKITYHQSMSTYLQQRIQSMANAYHVILLAYERLEHQYIVKPVTLHSSLVELRELLSHAHAEEPFQAPIYERFLNILSLYCALEIAAIFPVKNNAIVRHPITAIGNITPPSHDDFLIQDCLSRSEMAYISAKASVNNQISDYLVVAPFVDHRDDVNAVLIIQDIPFLQLNDNNLSVIQLFIDYFTSGHTVHDAAFISKQYPDCPVDFANELQRLMKLQQTVKQDSTLVAYHMLDTRRQDDYLFRLKQEKRGIDSLWIRTTDPHKTALILMPLTSRESAESYKLRINQLLSKEFLIELNSDQITYKSHQLSTFKTPCLLLESLLT